MDSASAARPAARNQGGGSSRRFIKALTVASIQAAMLAGLSNVIAQAISSRLLRAPFILDWVPIFQFFVFNLLITPLNFAWQHWLEARFPSRDPPPPPVKVGPSAKPASPPPGKPRTNRMHVLVKTVADQTAGAAVNSLLFLSYTFIVQQAMGHRFASATYARPQDSLSFLLSGEALDLSGVDWPGLPEAVLPRFSPLMMAGWKLWPAVSLFNFSCVESVPNRTLVLAVAGLFWGVYMSLFAAS